MAVVVGARGHGENNHMSAYLARPGRRADWEGNRDDLDSVLQTASFNKYWHGAATDSWHKHKTDEINLSVLVRVPCDASEVALTDLVLLAGADVFVAEQGRPPPDDATRISIADAIQAQPAAEGVARCWRAVVPLSGHLLDSQGPRGLFFTVRCGAESWVVRAQVDKPCAQSCVLFVGKQHAAEAWLDVYRDLLAAVLVSTAVLEEQLWLHAQAGPQLIAACRAWHVHSTSVNARSVPRA